MKNILKILSLLLVIALFAVSVTALAVDTVITLDGFTFSVNENNEAVIHEYDNREEDVVVPEKLLDANVIAIDDYAFFGNTEITSVSFENAAHLTNIGADAFYGCTGLKTVTIPDNIAQLGFGAFQDCTSLESVTLGSGLTKIGEQAFCGCTALRELRIPETVTTLASNSFTNCRSLEKLIIPDSVTTIADNALNGCDSLAVYCSEASKAHEFAVSKGAKIVLTDYNLGDVDLDGQVNINDVTLMQLNDVGLLGDFNDTQRVTADINGDGNNTIRDATLVQMYLASYSVPYKVNQSII